MKTFSVFILVIVFAALPGLVFAAEHTSKPKRPLAADSVPASPPRAKTNPCALYGAGFVQVPGSSTCIKVGGSVRVDTSVHR
jgi:hypothetical protein